MELPPRARRIPQAQTTNLLLEGTTSACAENTFPSTIEFSVNRNYLRVRGEYRTAWGGAVRYSELPPRARRIPVWVNSRGNTNGTTSACAENTSRYPASHAWIWNYLRVRGEYAACSSANESLMELPPRARRIRVALVVGNCIGGTTSACAENTFHACPQTCPARNYLRVRGEYTYTVFTLHQGLELPPRARRIRCRHEPLIFHVGTTSACAENTHLMNAFTPHLRNYLRVRGEYPHNS